MPPKKQGSSLIVLLAMAACLAGLVVVGIVMVQLMEGQQQLFVSTIPADERTGLKSWARVYWLGGGMFESNIQAIDTIDPIERYDWSLKVVVDPQAELTSHFHEAESQAGIMTLRPESGNGVYVFDPMYTQFLLVPWIEHNFGFKGVDVGPDMHLEMFLVLHLADGDHEIPIHLNW